MLTSLNRNLAIFLVFGLFTVTCTKKKSSGDEGQSPVVDNTYVPATWDLKSDFSSSTLKAKDIDP